MRKSGIKSWWLEDEKKAHASLFALIDHVHDLDSSRRDDDLYHMALYGDRFAKERMLRGSRRQNREDRLSFNLTKALADAMQAEISSITPRPKLLTSHGNWTHKRRAQSMELMLEGEYDRNNVDELKDDAFLDAAKTGTTALKVLCQGGMPKVEIVPPGQLLVDPVEGQYRNPRAMTQIMPMQRDIALAAFGDTDKHAKMIDEAPTVDVRTWFPWLPVDSSVEQILVAEAWRLPDPEDWRKPTPGKRIIAVESGVLGLDDWERETFPINVWRFDKESSGFWGRGVVQNARSAQRELNYVLMKISECIHRSAGFRYFVEGNSKVNVEKLTNEPGSILRYFGAMPQAVTESSVPAELLRHADDIIRRAFEAEGVSMMAASAKKPAGLDSGAALREYNDIKSERFIVKTRSLERFVGVELAKNIVDTKREIAESGDEKPVKVKQRRGRGSVIKMMDWKDAELDEDSYSIQIFPASALPSTPAGRIATVEQWMGSGLISRDQGMQLLDFPDIENFVSWEMAPYDAVLSDIETMIEDGEYVTPEPTQNLELSSTLVTSAYLKFRTENAPSDRLELLLRYLDDCQFLQDKAGAAANTQAPAAGAVDPTSLAAQAGIDPTTQMQMPQVAA